MVRYATSILNLNFSLTLLQITWCGIVKKSTYINTFDSVAHHIFRLEQVSFGKVEVETTALESISEF
jgi:hypothetical protein